MKQEGYSIVDEVVLYEDFKSGRKTTFSILGITLSIVGSGGVGWVAYRLIRSAFSDGTRRCGVFGVNTKRRQVCMLKVKLQQLQIAHKYVKSDRKKKTIEKGIKKLKLRIDKLTKELKKKGKEPLES
jgi:hypothetical protein